MDKGNAGSSSSIASKRNRRFGTKNDGKWLMYVGDFRCLTDFLAKKHYDSIWAPLKFLDALLRGYSQATLANNPVSGLFIAIALAIANPIVSLSGLVTASVGLLVSLLLDQDRGAINAGLTVYNPLLVGLLTGAILPGRFGLELDPILWLLMLATTVFCVYVTSALSSLLGALGRFPIPCFTLSFNVVQIMLLLTVANMRPYNHLIDANNLTAQPTLRTTDVATSVQPTLKYNRDLQSRTDVSSETNAFTFNDRSVENDDKYIMFSSQGGVLGNDTEFQRDSGTNLTRKDVHNAAEKNLKLGNESVTDKGNEFVVRAGAFPAEKVSDSLDNLQVENGTTINDGFVDGDGLEDAANDTSEEQSQYWHLHVENSSSVDFNDAENEFATEKTLLNWGEVFAGVILSMSQIYGLCDVAASTVIYLAVLIYSPMMAAFALLGALLGTLLGVLLSEPPYEAVYTGVWGWNSALCSMALGGFCFVLTWQSALAAGMCGLFGTVLQHVLGPVFAQVNLSPMSFPFNIATMLFLCITSANQNHLVRPEALTFPEKHRYDFQQQLQQETKVGENSSAFSSAGSLEVHQKKKKMAPLAEQEVV